MTAAGAPIRAVGPSIQRVAEHAVEQIVAAVDELWPGAPVRLGEHVPSVTSYVHRIEVDGRALYAKYSILGASLVSVTRGVHGTWDTVLSNQLGYVNRPDAVLAREVQQLRVFAERGPLLVCAVAGYARGVLLTHAVTGARGLDELLLAEPSRAPELLRQAWTPVTRLHAAPVDGWPLIAERDITSTFTRKFLGDGNAFQAGRITRGVDPDVVAGLRYIVRRLRAFPATRPTGALIFGEVKPEHVLLGGSEPVYLDPGAHVASAVSDLAKLVSRLVLLVIGLVPDTAARQHILAALTNLLREERSGVDDRQGWMVELLTLAARDATNIISTYLAAPGRFPLPRTAGAVVEHVALAVRTVEHLVTGLAQRALPEEIWAELAEEVTSS